MLGIRGQLLRVWLMVMGVLVSCGAFSRPASGAPATYVIEDLGTLGGSYSRAWDINNRGEVVGHSQTAGGQVHAFLYRNRTMIDIGTLGGSNSEANAINDAGQVVGYAHLPNNSAWRAYRYENGVMVNLGTLGGLGSLAYDINDAGHTVGWSNQIEAFNVHAYVQDGVRMIDLGTLAGTMCVAYGINNAGKVVGQSSAYGEAANGTPEMQYHAFLLDGASMVDLGTLGGSASAANAINGAGHVVGWSRTTGDSQYRAFLWTGGTLRDLGTLGDNSAAFGINTAGDIVGRVDLVDGTQHAMLYRGGTMIDINTLLPPVSGWELVEARAINDSGQMVGLGYHNGAQRAYLMRPVVPDTDAPNSLATRLPIANAAGWNNASVTVTLAATDAGSGVQSLTYAATGAQSIPATTVAGSSTSVSITAEGVTTITVAAIDNVGNVEAPKTLVVKIDKTAPTLTFGARTPAPNSAGWNRAVVDIPFTAFDALSGIDPPSPAGPLYFGSDGANLTQTVTIIDLAGNSATFTSPAVNLDMTPPVLTPTRSPAPNANGWNKANVTVSFTCTDALSGIATKPASVIVSTIGANQAVTRTATDKAGNFATAAVTISIDKTKPTLTFGTPFPAPNAAGWNNTNVSVPFTATDDLSGVATTIPVASPRVLSAQGADLKGDVTVTDKAGNSASLTMPSVRIDTTKPTVTYAGNAGTYTVDQVVSITCTPADALSGIASHTCQGISGPAHAFALGSNSLSATATDTAGNLGTGTAKFTVKVTYVSLKVLTQRFVTDTAVADALCGKLDQASAAAAAGKGTAKKAAIDGYVAMVTAQGGKALTAEQAAVLVRLARAV